MLHSVRARLAAWYAGVFAVFLAAFAVAIYVYLRQSSLARIDEFLAETASAVSGAMEFERNSGDADTVALADVVEAFRLRETDVVVLDRTTSRAHHARVNVDPHSTSALVTAVPEVAGIEAIMRATPDSAETLRTMMVEGEPLRIYTMPYTLGRHHLVIATVQKLARQQKQVRETEIVLLVVLPVFLALATVGGYVLARKGLRPVATMSERAAVIGASSLHERLPVGNPRDELGRLASVFNELLDRLQRAFEEKRRFMEDASHELRTPVAIISGESELALSRADRRPEELRDALAAVRVESKRLREIVDDLFLLTRAEGSGGARPMRTEELYLRDVVEECVRAARTLAVQKGIELSVALGDDDLQFTGDEALLKRLVMNVIDNALKYTPDHGRVSVSAERVADRYEIDVADSGPGIPAEARDLIFERFYRGPVDLRGPRPSGAGLGLAIARWIARLHGGELTLFRSDAQGSVFRTTLPVPPSAATGSPRTAAEATEATLAPLG